MRIGVRISSLLVFSTLWSLAFSANAEVPTGAKRVAVPVVRSGAIAQSRTVDVRVLGVPNVKVGDLADVAFKDVRVRNGGLSRASSALLAPPVNEETFSETDTTVTLTTSVKMTIVDPDGFRASAPAFRSFNAGMKDRGTFTVAQFKPEQKKRFDAFKAELQGKPANHPLRIAAQAGDNALLDAIARGQGDVTITTTVVVPKDDVKMQGTTAMMPKFVEGGFDYAQLEPTTYKVVKPMTGSSNKNDGPQTSGSATEVTKFLTGFTKSQSFDWHERWDLGTHDYFKIGAHAGYGLGVRVPVEITATMDPMKISSSGLTESAADYSVKLSARTVDANTAYYTDAGLSPTEASDGKEFVLEAHAYVSIDVVAGWGVIDIHQTIPGNTGFDFGQNFTPPFGNCGTNCGLDVWIPAAVTRTQIGILGIVNGSAQIGFNLSGKGTIGVDYTSRSNGKDLQSRLKSGSPLNEQHLTFDGPGQTTVTTSFPPSLLSMPPSSTTDFGYRLSNPTYTWGLVATPGVKGTVSVNAKPFFSLEEVIGPYWLDAFAMKLGNVTFKTHDGTRNAFSVTNGTKTFTSTKPGANLPKDTAPVGTVVMPKK